jgi:hypothetical protein
MISTTTAANFATSTTGFINTMEANNQTAIKRCPNKIIKTFAIEDFFHLQPVSMTPVVHLELQISQRIFEKFETALMVYSGAWGKLIQEKNLK